MKRIIFILNFVLLVNCNMSDRTIELPNEYEFEREGLYSNIVTKNHKLIIDHAALDYSYNDKYLMFVYDTIKIIPDKIINSKLFFLVVDLSKDTISPRMNYIQYKKFMKNKSVDVNLDLSIRNYPK